MPASAGRGVTWEGSPDVGSDAGDRAGGLERLRKRLADLLDGISGRAGLTGGGRQVSGAPAYGFSLERKRVEFDERWPFPPSPRDVARFVPAPGPIGSRDAGSPPPFVVLPQPPATFGPSAPSAPASSPEPPPLVPPWYSWTPGAEAAPTATYLNPATGTEAVPTFTGGVGDVPPVSPNVAPGQTPIFYSDPFTGNTSPTPLPGYAPIY